MPIYTNAQLFGNPQSITVNIDGGSSIFASDIDGDGDMDVLSASRFDNKLAWYKNTDGQGSFGAQQIITSDVEHAISVFAADLDGDGDADVLSASRDDHTIAWYENTDGLGDFGPKQIITTNATYTTQVYAADLDSDGDMDVLSASGSFAWYENDGTGNFLTHIIETDVNGIVTAIAADIDDDGDMDVLSGAYVSGASENNKIQWYENTDGQGNFGDPQTITSIPLGTNDIETADLDGDGDLDVLSSSWWGPAVAWYENLDGLGSFGAINVLTSYTNQESIAASDIDGDGDIDILSSSEFTGNISWYENIDGQGSFGSFQSISGDPVYSSGIFMTDIDGDSDIDLVSLKYNEIDWLENNTIILANDFSTSSSFTMYPNPTSGKILIDLGETFSETTITAHTILGQRVLNKSYNNSNSLHFNLEGNAGVYLLTLITSDGKSATFKVVKQ